MNKLEDIWYWIVDNKQIVGAVILVALVVVIIVFAKTKGDSNRLTPEVESGTMQEVKAMKDVSEELDETFSMLDEINATVHHDYPAYEISLFLKKPFINKKEFEDRLKDFVDMYKWKTNDSLSGMEITVYDRKEVYDKDLKPRAFVYYAEELSEEDLTDVSDGGTRERGEDTNRMNFQETIGKDEKPDYDDYDLTIHEFKKMTPKEEVEPLTDQEFSFYLKMDLYRTLMGRSRYGSAKTYLEWDLGKDVYKDGIVAIEREFEEFDERHTELGGQDTYYDNELLLKQEMVIENPQFLLFVTRDEVEDDPIEAQKKLLEADPELYKKPLQEYIEERSGDISDEFENIDGNDEDNEEGDKEEGTEEENTESEDEFEFEDEENNIEDADEDKEENNEDVEDEESKENEG